MANDLLCFRHLSERLFCLVLYTEINLQTFVLIQCKTICHKYLCTESFILFIGFLKKKSNILTFIPGIK